RYWRPGPPGRVGQGPPGGEPRRRNEGLVHDDLPRRLGDETKVTRVIPHGPPDPVYLERGADVGNPPHSVAGSRDTPIDAKLVTHHANISLLRPGGDLFNLSANACSVPRLMPITGDQQLGHVIGQPPGHRRDVVWTGGIRDRSEVSPQGSSPSGTLMREYMRQVKVEVVDDLGVAERL